MSMTDKLIKAQKATNFSVCFSLAEMCTNMNYFVIVYHMSVGRKTYILILISLENTARSL